MLRIHTTTIGIACSIALTTFCVGVADAQCVPVVHQKLTIPNEPAGSRFGEAVAIDGDRVIVGAYGDNTLGTFAGAAYIYQRVGNAWQQQAKLFAPDAAAHARYGTAVSIRGNFAVVGAAHHDANGENSGSIYVYRLVGNQWLLTTQIFAPVPQSGAFFGWSVSTDGERIVVGAHTEDVLGNGPTPATNNGAAYVYRRVIGGAFDGDWVFEQKLLPDQLWGGTMFGYGVAIDGDALVVGAPHTLKPGFQFGPGAAYFFSRSGNVWSQTSKVSSPDTTANERFGRSVAISGSRAAIGAPMHSAAGSQIGAAYTYVRNGDATWSLDQKVMPSAPESGSQFGERIAIDGTRLVVGAPFATGDGMPQRGNAWMFSRGTNGWGGGAKVMDSTPQQFELFGSAVGVSGEYAIVGCPVDGYNGLIRGSATIFKHNCSLPTCSADLNGDGTVDGADLGILLAAWGGVGAADLNGDGTVNGADLGVLLAAWGACP